METGFREIFHFREDIRKNNQAKKVFGCDKNLKTAVSKEKFG